MVCCDKLLSLGMFLRLIYVPACISILFFPWQFSSFGHATFGLYSPVCFYIHQLVDTWVVSTFWLLWLMLLWTSVYKFAHLFSHLQSAMAFLIQLLWLLIDLRKNIDKLLERQSQGLPYHHLHICTLPMTPALSQVLKIVQYLNCPLTLLCAFNQFPINSISSIYLESIFSFLVVVS